MCLLIIPSYYIHAAEDYKTNSIHMVIKNFTLSELGTRFPTLFTSDNPMEQRLLTAGKNALAEVIAAKIEYITEEHHHQQR